MKGRDLIELLKGNEDREVFVPARSHGAVQNLTEDMIFIGTNSDHEPVVEISCW